MVPPKHKGEYIILVAEEPNTVKEDDMYAALYRAISRIARTSEQKRTL